MTSVFEHRFQRLWERRIKASFSTAHFERVDIALDQIRRQRPHSPE
jgi:hypothetical protein